MLGATLGSAFVTMEALGAALGSAFVSEEELGAALWGGLAGWAQWVLILLRERRKMLTGKQRSYLKALGQKIDPSVYIGKQGITENVLKEMEVGYENRELVKVKLQEGCLLDTKEAANEVAEATGAEFVQAIGRRFVLYKESKENKQIELPRK